jgi:phage head maturation protease
MNQMKSEFFGPAPEFRGIPAADGEMALVNRFSLKPLSRQDVALFTMQLCHNQLDKHHSRFADDELPKINRMVVGRPLMTNHDLKRLPKGIFFDSRVQTIGAKMTVCPSFYILRTAANAEFIGNIEGGIYRETSIGFAFDLAECSVCHHDLRQCDHQPGERYGREVCYYTMHNVTSVIEGSIVPAGSQETVVFGMRNLPVCAKDGIETERLCSGCGECACIEGEDLTPRVEARPYPNEHACRLRQPSQFQPDTYARMTRNHKGKPYDVLMARLKGEDTLTDQAFRYARDIWTASEAGAHCRDHDGSFEAATGRPADEKAAIDVNNLGDFVVDAHVDHRELTWQVKGYCVMWGTASTLHPSSDYPLIFHKGEFEESLRGTQEILCLRNHDGTRFSLGRRSDGTFRVQINNVGIWCELDCDDVTRELIGEPRGWSIGEVSDPDVISSRNDDQQIVEEDVYSGTFNEVSIVTGDDRPRRKTTIEIIPVNPVISHAKRRVAIVDLLGQKYKTLRYFQDFAAITRAEIDAVS